jgi:hypothetical protein
MYTSSIIPLRFRIDATYLRDKVVATSNFAYAQACKDFLESMERLVSSNHPVSIPYRRLNTVMVALMPTLAHPFVQYPERHLLVVGEDTKRRPTAAQISDVVYEWGKQWGDQSFREVINDAGRDAYRRLLNCLQEPVQQWQDFDAAELFLNRDESAHIRFRAIPSLLASLLAGRQSTIHGISVRWHLTQDGDYGLAVISQPFWATYEVKNPYTQKLETKRGTFSYKLEFRLQTQVGSSLPWIHLYVRCSRYVDNSLRKKNWQRDVSIKMGVDQARVNGWACSPTLVTLPVAGSKTNPRWDEQLVPLLAAMKARPLIEPVELFQDPMKYRTPTPPHQHDKYFVLHAEGFKPKHQVKTGFDFAEIHEVASSVSDLLGLELSAGQTLTVDHSGSFRSLADLPLSMCNTDELRRKVVISSKGHSRKKLEEAERKQAKEDSQHQNELERQRIVLRALRRAACNQPIVIYLCWWNTFTKRQLMQELRRALFLQEGDAWPEDITLVIPSQPTPNHLLEPLDAGQLDPFYRYTPGLTWQKRRQWEEAWEKQMHEAFAAKTQAWESYLNGIRENRSGYGLALVELQKLDEEQYHKDQNIKGAVRRACNRVGLSSQMISPLIPLPKPIPNKGDIVDESRGRLRNAVADLLYRQPGLIYESPKSLYEKAGLPPELAEQLHIVGLYRLSRRNPGVDYALAICLCPDGTYRALLPQHPEQWLPLQKASQMIGELFFNKKAETINLPKEELACFAARVFTCMKDMPTLVLFEASDWRNRDLFPQFANGETALQNQLDLRKIKSFERLYSSQDLPHLRIIRLRRTGTVGETPQYVPLHEEEEKRPTTEGAFEQYEEGVFTRERDFRHLTGIVDTQAVSPFFHYLSIGRIPITVAGGQKAKQPQYKLDKGGGIAFKHQTIVEFVPFFLQAEDDAQAWCRVAHFMRFSPGWDGGNIILSFPMHLAKSMLEDQLCILESGLEAEEE